MKTIYVFNILIYSIFLFYSENGYSQNFYWSKQIKGNNYDGAGTMINNNDGALFFAGYTKSSFLYFEHDTIGNSFYLAKYDEEGNEIWAKGFNAPMLRLVLDTARNAIITGGTFTNTGYFGDTILTGEGITIYFLKMDLDGNIIWIRTAGGSGKDYLNDITCDPQGNIYIAGCNDASANFGGQVIPPGGYIAKYSSDGSVLWAKQKFRRSKYSAIISEVETHTILATNEAVFLNGSTVGDTIIVDTISIIKNTNYECASLASFTPNGDAKWMNIYGQPGSQCGRSIVHNNQGGLYTTGRFFGTCIFGNDTLHSSEDCYITKHKPDGEIEWTRQLNATVGAWGLNLVSDKLNCVYLSGFFNGTAYFGNVILTENSTDEGFVARYDSAGNCSGAFSIPNVYTYNMAIDPHGNLGISGAFSSTATIGRNTFTSMGDLDIYLAKCSPITGMGTQNNFIENKLLIYANPTTGKCNITVPDAFLNEKLLTLTIYNNQGKAVYSTTFNLSEDKIRLNLSAYADGIYTALLTNGKKSYTGRIVFAGR